MEITGVLAGMMLGLLVNVLLVIGVNNWKRCLQSTDYPLDLKNFHPKVRNHGEGPF